MTLRYTPAEEEDLPRLFQLNKALMHQYEDLTQIDYQRVLAWVQENLRRQLPNFRRILFNGQLAGYFCLCEAEEKWELDSLFVFPEYQNRGIGTEVLRHCLILSGGRLFLYVFKANTGAVRLYQRMGFRTVGQARNTAWIMEYQKQDC